MINVDDFASPSPWLTGCGIVAEQERCATAQPLRLPFFAVHRWSGRKVDVALEVEVHAVKEHTLVLELVGSEVLEVVIELVLMSELDLFKLNTTWLSGGILRVRSHLIGVLLPDKL